MAKNKSMSIGAYNHFPHYHVSGGPVDFYVYIAESEHKSSSSKWITGKKAFALLLRLRHLYKKDRKGFIDLVRELHEKYRKMG